MDQQAFSLSQARRASLPELPSILTALARVTFVPSASRLSPDKENLQTTFPQTANQESLACVKREGEESSTKALKIGVLFSGGPAPGGHNVILGLFDGLKECHPESELIGFLGGASGLLNAAYKVLHEEAVRPYQNQGGFDLLGSGRTKIETEEQFRRAGETAKECQLDGLVIIGGDDSNTNAALLAEYFLRKGIKTNVIGIPKTIDGDLKNGAIPLSFGFDTACKVYSEMIGNIARDAISSIKYYHFIKLMGRSASHIVLECALKTRVNLAFIGEEVAQKEKTLLDIVREIADVVEERAKQNKQYGVILIPEGLIEFIPEVKQLIEELNATLAEQNAHSSLQQRVESIGKTLSEQSQNCFFSLPAEIQKQLLLDRDPHGNVQLSQVETEKLLIEKVTQELQQRKEAGRYSGDFRALSHFFGYEGRCSFPSLLDSNYGYALGKTASALLQQGVSGYMAQVTQLQKPVSEWRAGGVPLCHMIQWEQRKGKTKPVIAKALVDLSARPFREFAAMRNAWKMHDGYLFPGPMQYFGPALLSASIPLTLQYESENN